MVNKRNLKIIGVLCILLGIVFVGYGFKDSIHSYRLRQDVEEQTTNKLDEAVNKGLTNDTKVKETEWIYPTEEYTPVTSREDNTNEYASIGALIIPRIDQTIAIMEGMGGNNMYRGAGTHYHDMEMGQGNYVLSSHRMYDGNLFGRLEEVLVGDSLYITDYETLYKYEVVESDNNVETTRTHLLKDTVSPTLTIYGCTSDGEMRVVKQAVLVGYSKIVDLGEEDLKLLNERETYNGH